MTKHVRVSISGDVFVWCSSRRAVIGWFAPTPKGLREAHNCAAQLELFPHD